MLALKFIFSMFFLATLIPGRDGINTCPCNKFACLSGTLICADDSYICYSAVRRLPDGSEKTETGCATADDCASRRYCADDTQTCLKYGCCNTSLCVANFTYFYTAPSPSPTPTPAEMRESTPVQIATSAPARIPTSAPAPAPATTQISPVEKLSTPVVQASPTKKPAVAATSSVPEKMSSEPAMATSKAAQPMMSSQKQVEPTESKEVMMSSEEKMKPTPSQVAGNTAIVISLVDPNRPTVGNRPTCPDSSERVYSLGVFALVAIAILCNVF